MFGASEFCDVGASWVPGLIFRPGGIRVKLGCLVYGVAFADFGSILVFGVGVFTYGISEQAMFRMFSFAAADMQGAGWRVRGDSFHALHIHPVKRGTPTTRGYPFLPFDSYSDSVVAPPGREGQVCRSSCTGEFLACEGQGRTPVQARETGLSPRDVVEVYRGTSPRRKHPPTQDPPRTLGIGLL